MGYQMDTLFDGAAKVLGFVLLGAPIAFLLVTALALLTY